MRKLWERKKFVRLIRLAPLCLMPLPCQRASAESVLNFAELRLASTLTVPAESTEKEKSVMGNVGLRLSFRDADLRGYAALPKTGLGGIRGMGTLPRKIDSLDDIRYGAAVYLFRETVPVTLRIGHISYSKSVSKMRNPSPGVTANPLTKSFAFGAGTGASLPTLTSSAQPLSCSVSARTEERVLPVQVGFEGFVSEKNEKAASISMRYKISRSVSLQSALSMGSFYLENNSAALRKNNAAFPADFFYSGLGELNLSSPLLKMNLYTGIHQSPYGGESWWLRIDGRTSLRALLLNFSYFAVPSSKRAPKAAPLIGGSSSVCRTVEQAGVNPQMIFLLNDKRAGSVRVGLSVLESWKVTSTSAPVQLNTLRIRAGAAYESRFLTLRLDWTRANILIEGEPPTKSSTPEEYQSIALSSSYAGARAKISLSGGHTLHLPPERSGVLKETYSSDMNVAFPGLGLAARAGLDITFKGEERSAAEFSSNLTYTIKRRYLRASLRFGLVMPF